jgi:hypothetical protein
MSARLLRATAGRATTGAEAAIVLRIVSCLGLLTPTLAELFSDI